MLTHDGYVFGNIPAMRDQMFRLLLVGAGLIAREHAKAAMTPEVCTDGAEVHVTDPSPQALDMLTKAIPHARVHADLQTMLAMQHSANEVVVVATPPDAHADTAGQALASGRHVLVEKPLTTEAAAARELASLANDQGVALGCCDTRFNGLPVNGTVRDLVHAGRLGRAYHLSLITKLSRGRTGFDVLSSTAWFRDPRRSGGGVISDWTPYDIALMDRILEPESVEISAAWCEAPQIGGPFASISQSLEQHVGATMRLRTSAGSEVNVSYERAAATHGEERHLAELEGVDAAVRWEWVDWRTDNQLVVTGDVDGQRKVDVSNCAPPDLPFHHRPLRDFLTVVGQGPAAWALETAGSLFRLEWSRALIDVAQSGAPRSLKRCPS
jgi:predicted dehydrogenase